MAGWGKRIKDIRENKNMTQEELADRLGTNSRTVRRWESEGSIPDAIMGLKLSKELNISLNELFSEALK